VTTVVASVVDVTSVLPSVVLTRAVVVDDVVVPASPADIPMVISCSIELKVVTGVVAATSVLDVIPVVTSRVVRRLVETGSVVQASLVGLVVIFVVSDGCAEAKPVTCVVASAAVVVKSIVVM